MPSLPVLQTVEGVNLVAKKEDRGSDVYERQPGKWSAEGSKKQPCIYGANQISRL